MIIIKERVGKFFRVGNDEAFELEHEEVEILQTLEDIDYEGALVSKHMRNGQLDAKWRFHIDCIQHALKKPR